jgi:ABC-type multidrug transport system fused ATPase/permease subunit
MEKKLNKLNLVLKIWSFLPLTAQHQFWIIVGFSVVVSLLEIAFIGSIFPILTILTDPKGVQWVLSKITKIALIKSYVNNNNIFYICTFGLAFLAIISAGLRIALIKKMLDFSFGVGLEIGNEIYRRTLYQPYLAHITRNSSEVITGISTKSSTFIMSGINPLMILITNAITIAFVMIALFIVEPIITFIVFVIFLGLYLFVGINVKGGLRRSGEQISLQYDNVLKNLQEGLGSIRDTLINGTQEIYCTSFKSADSALRKAQAKSQFLAMSPRYLVEAVIIVLMSISLLAINRSQGENYLPLIAIFALAAQRLLPLLQSLFNSWANFESGIASILATLKLLEQKIDPAWLITGKRYSFSKKIILKDVSFCYPEKTNPVFSNVNLTINKGDIIGLIGMSGSGKSTFVDNLLGLLSPTHGSIVIDDFELNSASSKKWQTCISHVPQNVFLTDASIAENISFSNNQYEIDKEEVKRVSKISCIDYDIERMEQGYETIIGERGIRLSGGQKQRIGIARALFKKGEVLVLDESTSALDYQTEDLVLKNVSEKYKGLTIIIISHRVETLSRCNRIFKVENGCVIEVSK